MHRASLGTAIFKYRVRDLELRGQFRVPHGGRPVTLWLDVIPMALFQVLFLWLACHEMLGWNTWISAGIVAAVQRRQVWA